MKSICFFASYFTTNDLPYYIGVYLQELKKHFSEVVLFTSQQQLSDLSRDFLAQNKIDLRIEENNGFDFGMWYKAFQLYDVKTYDQIALVNDSCVLFKPLSDFMAWSSSDPADAKGMTLSEAVSPHIQSYFILLNKKAIPFVTQYFLKHGILTNIKEVIRVYEIGMSNYLSEHALKLSALVDNDSYTGEFSPYYHCIHHHLKNGIPLIKKKILLASYRKDELFTLARMNFNISAKHYIDLIKETNQDLIIDFSKVQGIDDPQLNYFGRMKYYLNRLLIKIYRRLNFN